MFSTTEQFVAALAADWFSHVSYRSWCGVNFLHVYRRDAKSPTGCILSDVSVEDTAANRAILSEYGRRAQEGGLMGHAACVASIRGR